MRLLGTAFALLLAVAAPVGATTARAQSAQQETTTHVAPATPVGEAAKPYDFITPHITDSDHLEYPCFNAREGFACELDLRKAFGEHWYIPGTQIDMRPTKHVVMLWLAAVLSILMLGAAARAHARHTHDVGRPKGFAAGIEAMVLYLRNEVAIPNLGPHGERFAPFVMTLFFFVLFANLLGLIPYGSTATGNISVTATLALITLVVVEVAGMRAQGLGYLNTIFYWNNDLPAWLRPVMFVIMTPVEMVGKLSKPFALAIRLFANMTAGHIVVLAFIGLFFAFGIFVGLAPLLMAVGIMILEIFVAFLQAFIFCLLAAVFIGQIREAHH